MTQPERRPTHECSDGKPGPGRGQRRQPPGQPMARGLWRGPGPRRQRGSQRDVRGRWLLARPGVLHLEHQDAGRPRADPGHAGRHPADHPAQRLATGRADQPRRWGDRRLVHLRDGRVSRPRPHPPQGRPMLDPAHHHGRAQGLRGKDRRQPHQGRRTRRAGRPQELAGAPAGRGGQPGLHHPALCGGDRRWPGRHCPGRPAAAPGCAGHHPGAQPAGGRQLAQPLQVAVPARPGLVRPPALPALPERLAGVCAQGQDRRLAGDVHQGDGAQLLELHRVCQRQVR